MIELQNLSVTLGAACAVRKASLSIQAGDRLGVVGESGCGKSMLALSLMGMVPDALAVSGQITLNGTDMPPRDETLWRAHRARTMSMVFQEPMAALNPLRRVGDTVMEPMRVHLGLSRQDAKNRVLALFAETGIRDPELRLRQYPHQLSGGQRQRVLIALALACDPELLIADEPTTALDANVSLRITDLLVRLSQQRNMALVLISHDLGVVARATRDILVMYGGDIVERGPTAAVLAHPAHPYTQGLLGARPRIEQAAGKRRHLPTIAGSVPGLFDLPQGCRFSGRCPVEMPRCAQAVPENVETAQGFAACHRIKGAHDDG
jgi:peptide/nickel transport system ATP-binding protein